jgi:uncharacterized membrane protein
MPHRQREIAALLFLTAAMTTLDAYSTLNSSPWTSENFGADEYKAQSSRGYVRHAIVFSTAYAVASSMIAGSLWPLVGSTVANAYLWWLYERALERGKATGSIGWRNGS